MKIDLIPLNEPLHRRLEALAAGGWFMVTTIGGYFCLLFTVYLLFTSLWWLALLYAFWIYADHDTCETGGRPNKWVQSWRWWLYTKNYFSPRLRVSRGFVPDLEKNYLFCCFPHGVVPAGPFTNITCQGSNFNSLFPGFSIRTTGLGLLFWLPFTRDVGLAIGGVSCSARSLVNIMSRPEGGQIAILFPGGAAEAFHAQPGVYKFVVKNRKGFVKIALQTGAPLVPVITFGEPDVFDQVRGPVIRKVQNVVKKWFGFVPIVFLGSGFFQRNFGLIPRRTVLTTVVGKAIEVQRRDQPTEEEMDRIHGTFVEELVKLFDEYKLEFLENPDEHHLVLE